MQSSSSPSALSRLVPIAPAEKTRPSSKDDENAELTMPYTCLACAKRKVKCDKTKPCASCRKGRLECVYQAPAPRKRKRKQIEDAQDRADRFERILKENNLLPHEDEATPEESSNVAASGQDGHVSAGEKPDTRVGTLRRRSGRSRYIDSNIWKILGDDLHPSSDDEDDDFSDVHAIRPAAEPVDPYSAAFYGSPVTSQTLLDLHPKYDAALRLFNLYALNVDPVVKIVHVPSAKQMVQRSAANPSSIDKVDECLLFAIYHFAVCSATEQECIDILDIPKNEAKCRYHDGARKALVSCCFLKTTELRVLQAYVLFLLAVRNTYDPHTFYILTGTAVRIAQRIGIHRDGAESGLNPFDIHLRRCIFWQLLPLDGQAAQLDGTGLSVSADSWDTKQPWNINDEDIYPGMEFTPQERKGATDMIMCLARTEMGKIIKRIKPAQGNWARTWDHMDPAMLESQLEDLENTMETKYVRYCDISVPIQCLTIAMARAGLNSMRLRVRLPRTKTPSTREERIGLWKLCCKILDSDVAVRENQNLMRRFSWHLESLFFQWDPIIWILQEVRQSEPVISVAEAWGKIIDIYRCRPELQTHKRSIDIALGRLTLKVWDETHARDEAPLPEPPFIRSLRDSFMRREASRQSASTTPHSSTMNQFSPTQFKPADVAVDVTQTNWFGPTDPPSGGVMNATHQPRGPDTFIFPHLDLDVDWAFWEQYSNDPQSWAPMKPI